MTPSQSRIPHVRALDGLRGLAVGAVLLFHFGNHLTGGYLGVDLFFVLSGYLITSLLLAEHVRNESIGLGGFWSRRARRLLPALGLYLIGVAGYCLLLAPTSELVRFRNDALATIFYVANWRAILVGRDYWALFQSPSPLEHMWSLAIEEQFYLLWPLGVAAMALLWRRRAALAVLVASLGLAAVSASLMFVVYEPNNTSRAYYGTDTRAAAILFGAALAAALAVFGPARSRMSRTLLQAAGFAGVTVLAIAWVRLDGESPFLYQGGFLLLGLAATAVIAACAHPEGGVISRALGWRPLVWLGLISYGVYLWHWLVGLVVTPGRVGISGWPLVALQVAVTLAIAVLSYQFLELPIRRGAGTSRQWRWLVPIGTAVALLAVVVGTLGASPRAIARSTLPGQPDGVLVVGDSVGISLAPGLRRAGLPVADGSFVGCRLVRGPIDSPPSFENFPNCPIDKALPALLRRYRPQAVVVISGQWDLFDLRIDSRGPWRAPGSAAWNEHFAKRLRQVAKTAGARGAQVFIPTIPFMGPNAVGGTPRPVEGAFDPARVRLANEVLRQVAAERGSGFVAPELNRFLSPEGFYQRALADVSNVRPDGVHFGSDGAVLVGRWLADQISASTPELRPTATSAPGSRGSDRTPVPPATR